VTDEEEVIRRLRELGSRPIPDRVRRRHIGLAAAADASPPSRAQPRRRALVASIAAASVIIAGAVVVLAGGDGPDERPVITSDDGVTTSEPSTSEAPTTDRPAVPDDVPVDPFPDDPCKGPPPFAGQDPRPPGTGSDEDQGAGRQAESDAWEDFKNTCPDEGSEATTTTQEGAAADPNEEGRTPGAPVGPVESAAQPASGNPVPSDACAGPPPQSPGCSDPPVVASSAASPDRYR
jgi:hypothetical protein